METAVPETANPPAPANWQTAELSRIREIASSYPAWVNQLAQKLGYSIPELLTADREITAAVIVLLKAQVHYWSSAAKRLDTPENKQRAHKEKAHDIAEAIRTWQKDPTVYDLGKLLRLQGFNPPNPQLWKLVFYNWQKTVHEAVALRDALGYGESRFRELVGGIVARLSEPNQPPMKWVRAGQSTIYPSVVALFLLSNKLNCTAKNQRARIAETIWTWRPNRGHAAHPGFVVVLKAAGASCKPSLRPKKRR